jgi:hypothetical protein
LIGAAKSMIQEEKEKILKEEQEKEKKLSELKKENEKKI